jgi:hypothetical protein
MWMALLYLYCYVCECALVYLLVELLSLWIGTSLSVICAAISVNGHYCLSVCSSGLSVYEHFSI